MLSFVENKIHRFIELYKDSLTNIPKEVWLLSLIALINRAGSVVLPFLTLYLTQDLDWDKSDAAIVAACYGIGSMSGSSLGGYLTERYGSYKVMLFSLIFSGFAFFGFLISIDFYFLCIWSIITTTIADAYRPAVMAAIGSYSDDSNRTRGVSLIRMAVNLGVAIGPAFAGFLVAGLGYGFLFFVDGVTCLAAGIAFYFVFSSLKTEKPKDEESKEQNNAAYSDRVFLLFMLINIFNLVAFFQIISSVPVFLKEVYCWSEGQIGWFFFFNGFVIFLMEMPIVHYLDKNKDPIKSMMFGALLIAIAHLCLLIDPSLFLGIALYSIIVAVGEVINFPFIASVSLLRAGKGKSGNYRGITSTMFSLTFLIAPAGLILIEWIDYDLSWVVMAVLSFISILGLWLIRKDLIPAKNPSS